MTLNLGIVGYGYWGPNYLRALSELNVAKIMYCSDLNKENLKKVKILYPGIKTTVNYSEILNDSKVDAIIITTPPNTHFEIAKNCLNRDKHVLIEKPFVTKYEEGKELVEIAEKRNKKLMAGELYKFNPCVRKLKELISKDELGNVYYAYAERTGLGPIRKHANVLWDLATHDISIATYILDSTPTSISAVAKPYIQENVEDLVFLTLSFPNDIIYHIHASWIAPVKTRKTTVIGSKKMAVFDDVNKDESIKIFDRRIEKELIDSTPEYSDHQNIVRIGDVIIPKIEQSEPLKNQLRHFLECIEKNEVPLTDGKNSLKNIKILEAAEVSLKQKGKEVYLSELYG